MSMSMTESANYENMLSAQQAAASAARQSEQHLRKLVALAYKPVTDEQIAHMVQRFLGWRLPETFSPDAGISFEPEFNREWNAKQGMPPQRHNPVGTNLFDAQEAEAMVRYMLDGLPV